MQIVNRLDAWDLELGDVVLLEDGNTYLIIENYQQGDFNWCLLNIETMRVNNDIRPNMRGVYFYLYKKVVDVVRCYKAELTLTYRKS